jgi:hypothetical protein
MGEKRAPVHDYVRGVIDMAAAVLGQKDLANFAKPWAQYVSRIGGTGSAPTYSSPGGKKKAKKKAKK